MKVRCASCGKRFKKRAIDVARSPNGRFFCDKKCFGLSRRKGKPKAQKVAEKRIYDAEYRRKNIAMLKAKRHAYFKRTYDPVAAAVVRKARMPLHVEYCRRPEYRKWKKAYDKKYLAKRTYGPFAEAAMMVSDLNFEIKGRMTNHDIKWENKTCNKSQFRRREDKTEAPRGRPRQRHRRRDAAATVGA